MQWAQVGFAQVGFYQDGDSVGVPLGWLLADPVRVIFHIITDPMAVIQHLVADAMQVRGPGQ